MLLDASLGALKSPRVPHPTRKTDTLGTAGTGSAAGGRSVPQAKSAKGSGVGTAGGTNPPQDRRTSPPPATRRPASRDGGGTAERANPQQDRRSSPPPAPPASTSAQTSLPPPREAQDPDDINRSMIEARGVFSATRTVEHIVCVTGADGRDYFSTIDWYTKVGAHNAAILARRFFPAIQPATDSAVVPSYRDVLAQERVAASGHTEGADSRSFRDQFESESIDSERDRSAMAVDRESSSDSDSHNDEYDELAEAIEEGRTSAMRLHVRQGETVQALAGLVNPNRRKSRSAEKPVVDHKSMLLKATHRRSSAIYNPKGRMERPSDEDLDTTGNTTVHWPSDGNLETTMNTTVVDTDVIPKAGEVVVSFDVLSPTDLWEEIRLTPEHTETTPAGWD